MSGNVSRGMAGVVGAAQASLTNQPQSQLHPTPPSSAQLLSISMSNIENRESLLLSNKSSRISRMPMKIPDFTQLRKDLLYPLKEEIILPSLQSTTTTTALKPQAATVTNSNNAAIGSNDAVKSHVRFDNIGGHNSRENYSQDGDFGGDDAATRSSYSSDDTSDLMSEARDYADVDDERAEIMRLFFGEARYRPEGAMATLGGGGGMTASAVSIGAASISSPDGHGTRKLSIVRETDNNVDLDEGFLISYFLTLILS